MRIVHSANFLFRPSDRCADEPIATRRHPHFEAAADPRAQSRTFPREVSKTRVRRHGRAGRADVRHG